MKNIFLIWTIFYASLIQAAPPTSIGSEAGSKAFTQNIVLPNNQVTKLSGINSRIETGNANVLADPSAEGATTPWIPYADAAGVTPVDGTGGSPNVTVSNSATTPLAGAKSLVMVKDAVNRQGQGIAIPFTISEADKTKVLQVTFDYKVLSGTYADNDVSFWIYDVTNSALIQPAPYLLKNVIGAEKMSLEFQASTSTSYRLIAHVASGSALAYSLQFDNLFVGRQAKNYGSPVIDTKLYKPTTTGFTSSTTAGGAWKRVGDCAEIIVSLTVASITSGDLFISIPSGLIPDTSKFANTGSPNQFTGSATFIDVSANKNYIGTPFINADGRVQIYGNDNVVWNGSIPVTVAVGDIIGVSIRIPILGWSSSTIMSSDASTRVISAIVSGQPASALAGNPIIFPTVFKDEDGSYSNITGKYTAKTTGYYDVKTYIDANIVSGNNIYVSVNNNTLTGPNRPALAYIITSNLPINGVGQVFANAGDTIDIRATANISFTNPANTLSITKVSGPSQIAASSSINMRYEGSSTTVSNSDTLIKFLIKNYDGNSAYSPSTGLFTCPISGKYSVKALVTLNNVSLSTTQYTALELYKNGVHYSNLGISYGNGASTNYRAGGSDEVDCYAGDTLAIYSSSSVSVSTYGVPKYSHLAITRVGN